MVWSRDSCSRSMIKDDHFSNVGFVCWTFLYSVRFLLMYPVLMLIASTKSRLRTASRENSGKYYKDPSEFLLIQVGSSNLRATLWYRLPSQRVYTHIYPTHKFQEFYGSCYISIFSFPMTLYATLDPTGGRPSKTGSIAVMPSAIVVYYISVRLNCPVCDAILALVYTGYWRLRDREVNCDCPHMCS